MDKCPICGYKDQSNVKALSNVMSRYVLVADPNRIITMNSAEEKLELGEAKVKYIREDVFLKAKAAKETAATPVIPPTTPTLVPTKNPEPLTPPAPKS